MLALDTFVSGCFLFVCFLFVFAAHSRLIYDVTDTGFLSKNKNKTTNPKTGTQCRVLRHSVVDI